MTVEPTVGIAVWPFRKEERLRAFIAWLGPGVELTDTEIEWILAVFGGFRQHLPRPEALPDEELAGCPHARPVHARLPQRDRRSRGARRTRDACLPRDGDRARCRPPPALQFPDLTRLVVVSVALLVSRRVTIEEGA